MIALTVAQIAAIVGGELADISAEDAASLHVTGTVEFDSRNVTSGGLKVGCPRAHGKKKSATRRSRLIPVIYHRAAVQQHC